MRATIIIIIGKCANSVSAYRTSDFGGCELHKHGDGEMMS